MKKGIKLLIAGMLILTIGGCKSENSLEQKLDTNKIYKIGTTAEYPPFETLENGKIVGYDVDVIDEIAKKIGIKYECKDMNFDGLISALQSQKIDGGLSCLSLRF
ncbi:transporter substrate-binding domain-containing protein [Fusobacterium perfoetens]|uniref:transporter substrate-binding domain-containing protein n=1 Tax=Fusobacterium perfoetens TaxID=852 RepID=UPI001F24B6B1|nr:transporter substrate-binding domain-containing protein [Fusobacterium perfoetens]MCF2613277.1 transporter substrate-binding domain-containing protein [Fusobacterium perfoetens]